MNDTVIREALVKLLAKGNAHAPALKAVTGVSRGNRCRKPAGGSPTAPGSCSSTCGSRRRTSSATRSTRRGKSPEFPAGYRPEAGDDVDDEPGTRSVAPAAEGPRTTSWRSCGHEPRPHGRDPARRRPHVPAAGAAVVADHNAYHAGQLVEVRKQLGD